MCCSWKGTRRSRSSRAASNGNFQGGVTALTMHVGDRDLCRRAVVNFGVSYALPARYPTLGHQTASSYRHRRHDDHRRRSHGHGLYSDRGIPTLRTRSRSEHGFLGSNTAGDWRRRLWAPLANETAPGSTTWSRAIPPLTPHPSRLINLETTIAIERSARSGQPVKVAVEV